MKDSGTGLNTDTTERLLAEKLAGHDAELVSKEELARYQAAIARSGELLSQALSYVERYEDEGELTADIKAFLGWPENGSIQEGERTIAIDESVLRLKDELARLRADAERYRWLRGNWFAFGTMHNQLTEPGASYSLVHRAADVETLDAAIDAARKSRPC